MNSPIFKSAAFGSTSGGRCLSSVLNREIYGPWLEFDLYHADAAAIRANPGGAIAEAPSVLVKTLLADLKPAGAIEAIGKYSPATVALKLPTLPAPAGL
jgi:hypothetical protein